MSDTTAMRDNYIKYILQVEKLTTRLAFDKITAWTLRYLISAVLTHNWDRNHRIVGQTVRSGCALFPAFKAKYSTATWGRKYQRWHGRPQKYSLKAVSLYLLAEFLAGQDTHAITALTALQNRRRILFASIARGIFRSWLCRCSLGGCITVCAITTWRDCPAMLLQACNYLTFAIVGATHT